MAGHSHDAAPPLERGVSELHVLVWTPQCRPNRVDPPHQACLRGPDLRPMLAVDELAREEPQLFPVRS